MKREYSVSIGPYDRLLEEINDYRKRVAKANAGKWAKIRENLVSVVSVSGIRNQLLEQMRYEIERYRNQKKWLSGNNEFPTLACRCAQITNFSITFPVAQAAKNRQTLRENELLLVYANIAHGARIAMDAVMLAALASNSSPLEVAKTQIWRGRKLTGVNLDVPTYDRVLSDITEDITTYGDIFDQDPSGLSTLQFFYKQLTGEVPIKRTVIDTYHIPEFILQGAHLAGGAYEQIYTELAKE